VAIRWQAAVGHQFVITGESFYVLDEALADLCIGGSSESGTSGTLKVGRLRPEKLSALLNVFVQRQLTVYASLRRQDYKDRVRGKNPIRDEVERAQLGRVR
jgi:hypothetical protein